jgi:Flp pilus assembly protein TadG
MKGHRMVSGIARTECGAAVVEFAIISTVFVSFILAIAYLGMMLYADLGVHWALEKGARLAAINTSTTQTAVADAINKYLQGMGVPAATVTYTVSTDTITRAYITATLTETFTVPFIQTFTVTYSADTYVPQSS